MNRFKQLMMLCVLFVYNIACGGSQNDSDFDDDQAELGVAKQAISVSGTLKYLNKWATSQGGSGVGLRFQNFTNTTKPLVNVKYCLRSAAPVVETCTFTHGTLGTFTLNVPTGSYTQRVYWIPSDVARTFKLVESDGTTQSFDDDSVTVAVTGATMNPTIGDSGWPDTQDVARASTYANVRAWFDTLGNAHSLNSFVAEWSSMGTIKVQHQPSGPTSASGVDIRVNHYANPTNTAMWHELGHTIEINMHMQIFGLSGVWPSSAPYITNPMASCSTNSGGTQGSGESALREGWADFVALTVQKVTPHMQAGTFNCLSNTAGCGVTINTQNPLTMAACGVGSSTRNRNTVSAALVDLVDDENVNPLGTCLPDTTQLAVYQVVRAMRDTGFVMSQTGQSWGNSTIAVDETGLIDLLRQLQTETGVHLYNIWADSCFQPGIALGPLLN